MPTEHMPVGINKKGEKSYEKAAYRCGGYLLFIICKFEAKKIKDSKITKSNKISISYIRPFHRFQFETEI